MPTSRRRSSASAIRSRACASRVLRPCCASWWRSRSPPAPRRRSGAAGAGLRAAGLRRALSRRSTTPRCARSASAGARWSMAAAWPWRSPARRSIWRSGRRAEETAIATISALRGFGRWSAEIYLLFALGRADSFPGDDLAVQIGMQRLKGLAVRPDRRRMDALAETWRPYRGCGALFLWHYYGATTLDPLAPRHLVAGAAASGGAQEKSARPSAGAAACRAGLVLSLSAPRPSWAGCAAGAARRGRRARCGPPPAGRARRRRRACRPATLRWPHVELPAPQDRDLLRHAQRLRSDHRIRAREHRARHQLSAFELDPCELAHLSPFARHGLAASPPVLQRSCCRVLVCFLPNGEILCKLSTVDGSRAGHRACCCPPLA